MPRPDVRPRSPRPLVRLRIGPHFDKAFHFGVASGWTGVQVGIASRTPNGQNAGRPLQFTPLMTTLQACASSQPSGKGVTNVRHTETIPHKSGVSAPSFSVACVRNAMTSRNDRERWSRMLLAAASTAVSPPPMGVAPWFLTSRGLRPNPGTTPSALDDTLWAAVATHFEPCLPETLSSLQGDEPAPLIQLSVEETVEVWTEQELSAIHALSRLAHRAPDQAIQDRLTRACAWHLEHTQPDNATGHPWAVHVFALRAIDTGDGGAQLYAETLLHNCQMQEGRADGLSAVILQDAAELIAPSP